MAAPLVGAGIGAVTSLATGRDPLQGALLGGVGGGLFGGAGGIGSGFKELGGLFGSAVPSAGATVATSTPVLGGLELAGATTGAAGGALAGGGAGAVSGATASPFPFGDNALEVTGNTVNPALIGSSNGGQIPFTGVDRVIDAVTPSGGFDPDGNFLTDMVRKDPVGSSMLGMSAAQNIMNPTGSGVPQPDISSIRAGSIDPTPDKPLNVLSPADYTDQPMLDATEVTTNNMGALFPYQTEGFGGINMITGSQDPRRKFY